MKPLLFAIPVLAAAAACAPPAHETAPAAQPPRAVRVESARLDREASVLGAGGTVRARTVAVLSSRVVAPVVRVRVKMGDRVKAGQALLDLDGRDLAAARDRAEASLAASRNGVAAAEAESQAARAGLTLSSATHARISSLRQRDSATAGELDDAVAALRTAEARVNGAAARRVEADRAVEAATAAAREASIAASWASIVAPFTGVVSSSPADVGTLAMPGVPLVTIEDPRAFRLEVSVDTARLPSIAVGQRVGVQIEGAGDLEGTVAEIAREVNPVAHTSLVKIDLPSNEGLRSGMYGRVRLPGQAVEAVSMPVSALRRRGQLTFAYTVDRGVARMRLVRTGTVAGDRVAVLSGLAAGEPVILDPPADLQDGMPVRPSGAEAPARSRK